MRFSDELLGSEGERCEVAFDVDGCSYTSEGVIEAVALNGRAASVRFKNVDITLHGGYMAAVPFERITLLDSEDDVIAAVKDEAHPDISFELATKIINGDT